MGKKNSWTRHHPSSGYWSDQALGVWLGRALLSQFCPLLTLGDRKEGQKCYPIWVLAGGRQVVRNLAPNKDECLG